MKTKLRANTSSAILILILLLLAGAMLGETLASQKNAIVRGLVERQTQSSKYPVAYIRVTLAPRATPDRRLETYTDNNGLYYFQVPTGEYLLEVWESVNRPPVRSFILRVDKERVDVVPIVL